MSWYRTVAHQMFPFCPANAGPALAEYRSKTHWRLKESFSIGRTSRLEMIDQSKPESRSRFGMYFTPTPQASAS